MSKEVIEYNTATAAQKLGDYIIRFGVAAGIVSKEAANAGSFTGPQLFQILDDALAVHATAQELVDAGKAVGNGITVDIFWERQGFYFVHIDDLDKVSEEHTSLDACVRYLVLRGYTIRDVRRTRGAVKQPKPPVVPRKSNDAE